MNASGSSRPVSFAAGGSPHPRLRLLFRSFRSFLGFFWPSKISPPPGCALQVPLLLPDCRRDSYRLSSPCDDPRPLPPPRSRCEFPSSIPPRPPSPLSLAPGSASATRHSISLFTARDGEKREEGMNEWRGSGELHGAGDGEIERRCGEAPRATSREYELRAITPSPPRIPPRRSLHALRVPSARAPRDREQSNSLQDGVPAFLSFPPPPPTRAAFRRLPASPLRRLVQTPKSAWVCALRRKTRGARPW